MSQIYYKLYLDSVFELAETLVIKSEYAAEKINEYLTYTGHADSFLPHDARTWKYYLNICGEYHSTDAPIKITSLDTLEEIVFNKQNLSVHKATAQAYQYNSRYYRELLLKYPDNELLILGILYPADLNQAIAAKDFTVLSYPKHLVEDNELSLIDNINFWLDGFDIRWNNRQFAITDAMYGTTNMGVMYLQLVPLILNLRLKACKTAEAHSFHIREYLASHGMLDVYLSRMTKKQALFFYRNINYIERNAGKKDTFEWLVQKIMTDRDLPLSEYNMLHSLSAMPASFSPDVTFRKTLLNENQSNNTKADNYYNLENLLKKEELLAPGNKDYSEYQASQIETLFKRSVSSSLATKVLESSVIDYTDAVPYTLHSVLLNQWIYFTQTNRFKAYVRVKDPKTGQELVLSTKDAYLYYLYAYAKSVGINLDKIPLLFAMRVQREPTPDASELMSVVSKDISPSYAQFILSLHSSIGVVNTLDDFRNTCKTIHKSALEELYFVYQQEVMTTRGMTYAMVSRLYSDTWITPDNYDQNYKLWLSAKNLPTDGFNKDDWTVLYRDIYAQVTGLDMSVTENLGGIQKAMVAMLSQLSSYSIQIISEINSTAVKLPNWNTVRLEQLKTTAKIYKEILLGVWTIFKSNVYSKDYKFIELDYLFQNFIIKNPPSNGGLIEIPIDIVPSKGKSLNIGVLDLGIFRLNQDHLPLTNPSADISTYQNFQAYYQLTAVQKAAIKNVYCNIAAFPIQPVKVNINDFLRYTNMPGLKYNAVKNTYLNLFNYYYTPERTYNFVTSGDVTRLDAFWPNFSPEELDGFKLNYKPEGLDVFKLLDTVPLEVQEEQFNFTGGWDYLSVFSRTKKGDDERSLQLTQYSGGVLQTAIDISSVSVSLNNAFKHSTDARRIKGINLLLLNSRLPDLKSKFSRYTLDDAFEFTLGVSDFSFNSIIRASSINAFTNKGYKTDIVTTEIKLIYSNDVSPGIYTWMGQYEVSEINSYLNTVNLPNFNFNHNFEDKLSVDITYQEGTTYTLNFISQHVRRSILTKMKYIGMGWGDINAFHSYARQRSISMVKGEGIIGEFSLSDISADYEAVPTSMTAFNMIASPLSMGAFGAMGYIGDHEMTDMSFDGTNKIVW